MQKSCCFSRQNKKVPVHHGCCLRGCSCTWSPVELQRVKNSVPRLPASCQAAAWSSENINVLCLLNTWNSQQTLAHGAAVKGSAGHHETSMREEASWHYPCICRGLQRFCRGFCRGFAASSSIAVYKLFPKFQRAGIYPFLMLKYTLRIIFTKGRSLIPSGARVRKWYMQIGAGAGRFNRCPVFLEGTCQSWVCQSLQPGWEPWMKPYLHAKGP